MLTNARQQLSLRACIDLKKTAHVHTAPFFGLVPLNISMPTGDGYVERYRADFVAVAQGNTVPCSRGGPPLFLDE